MTNLFLTGATGFLGGRLLGRLDPARFGRITLLCRGEPVLPSSLQSAGNVTVIRAALDETEKYATALGPDTRIVHLAAITGKADRADYFRVNTDGTAQLAGAAGEAGVGGFLFASSIAVSFRDRRGYHYAESKLAAEQRLQSGSVPYCIFRPTIILGEGSPIWQSFAGLARRSTIVLPGNGRVRIQPIDVDDLVTLILDVLATDRFDNAVLEIGGRDVLTLDDFVTRIHRALAGGRPRILHLPLGLVLVPLRLLEAVVPSLLPVSSGKFASFSNDGTVQANALVTPADCDLRGIDDMIAALTRGAHD